jgi:hypothetical protein
MDSTDEPYLHQCTNVDGWCINGFTFFIPPCPWANKGRELALTFYFFLPSAQAGFVLGNFFFRYPPTPAQVSTSYLHLDYLAYAPLASSLPHLLTTCPCTHPPNYLPIHPHIYLPTYYIVPSSHYPHWSNA